MKFCAFNTSSDIVSVNYSLSLLLNAERKPSVKKRSTGPVSDRSTGVDFEFYRTDRVEKVLTGSISGTCVDVEKLMQNLDCEFLLF